MKLHWISDFKLIPSMKKSFLLAGLLFSMSHAVLPQVFTDSNLPIIVIQTDNFAPIPDDPKIMATMKIIYRGPGERNYLTDQSNPGYLDYNGRIGIELRGSSSQVTEKKQYGFTTRKADNVTSNNVSLLGMPAENDWILNSMVFDPAVIRDYLSYNLSRQIGQYASRTVYCEVVINNAYLGLYVLQEKIKADDNRVDILRLGPSDNVLPVVSGGYITKADKNTGGDPTAWTMYSRLDYPVNYIHEEPGPEDIIGAQHSYIRSQFMQLQNVSGNPDIANGYPSLIDIPSFIDFMLISELGSNADAYMFSTFFHKDRNGKLRAGPIWDNDLTYGNDLFFWGYDRSKTNIWQLANGDNEGSKFWYDLFNNTIFRCYLSRRWNALTQPGQPLHPASIGAFIDETVTLISEAVGRENARWGSIGDHAQRISNMKSWINTRISWITANLGSFSGCDQVDVPPLVISKIMYHPAPNETIPDEEDLEFIEITNNGDQAVNLTGVYFRNPGLVYQFPVNSTIGPRGSMVFASNAEAFLSFYDTKASGQFTRHLSNKSERLVLADAFGNIIDEVEYLDTIPWPEADGNGYYLKLNDPGLDNALAENWSASADVIVSDHPVRSAPGWQYYPNPVRDILRVEADAEITRISLTDMQGRVLLTVSVNSSYCALDMSSFSRGTYLIRVVTSEKTYTGKVVRE